MAIIWPTPNPSFFEGKKLDTFIQPSYSGKIESGLFGCFRNDGARFHGGIDIKPWRLDRNQEPLDEVFAALPGRVVYVNRKAGNSAYGNYVVIEHAAMDLSICTLYAHLAQIRDDVKPGFLVKQGDIIGIMGHTANHHFPKQFAHLHFEIVLRLTDRFQDWYDWNAGCNDSSSSGNYGLSNEPNHHGNWNGLNCVSLDPLDFYEVVYDQAMYRLTDYVQNLPTAFCLSVTTKRIPDFIQRYPSLLAKPIPSQGVKGWDIEFTWYGFPKKWTPLKENSSNQEGDIALLSYDYELLKDKNARKTIIFNSKNEPQIGKTLLRFLQLIFRFR